MSVLPEPFTRERADGKIPVKVDLIREQVRAELSGTPEGEAEVARWQTIETDYNQCRLSSAESSKAKAEEVFSVCMSERGYVYMFPIDAEQFHNDIAFDLRKERDDRLAAERKAEEERIAAEHKAEEERTAAEKKAEEEAGRKAEQKRLDDKLITNAKEGNWFVVWGALADGANINRKNDDGQTALYLASGWGRTAVVSLLLSEGANPDVVDNDGWTPLLNAAAWGHAEIVDMLLSAGANPNAAYDDGWTALMWAAEEGHSEVAEELLSAGANPNAANDDGGTALMSAAVQGHAEVAKVLLAAGTYVEAANNDGTTALRYAVEWGHSEVVEMLLSAGANPNAALNDNAKNKKGESIAGTTALMWAATKGYSEVVKVLLSAGANPNAADNDGWTALRLAAQEGYSEVAEELLSAGANPNAALNDNAKNKKGESIADTTALMWAATKGHSEVVKVLLSAGANPNAAGNNGWTALLLAVSSGHAEVARILLECGASPDWKNKYGKNTRDWATQRPLIVPVLEKYDAKIRNGWHPKSCKNRQVAAAAKPKAANAADSVFANVWRSVVIVRTDGGQGSGVIVRPNVVATNCHVVDGGGNLAVSELSATIRKRDDKRDFCLLNVAGLQGDIAKVRRWNTLTVGENVYGLGAPQGLDLSLSSGIISQLRQGGGERFIQTDAAISPGSSGGGLFDANGNLIGIMTFKIADENVEGIGFAIPADLVLGY